MKCQPRAFEPLGAWMAIRTHSSTSSPGNGPVEIEAPAYRAGRGQKLVGREVESRRARDGIGTFLLEQGSMG
jgi:hypothetical protein